MACSSVCWVVIFPSASRILKWDRILRSDSWVPSASASSSTAQVKSRKSFRLLEYVREPFPVNIRTVPFSISRMLSGTSLRLWPKHTTRKHRFRGQTYYGDDQRIGQSKTPGGKTNSFLWRFQSRTNRFRIVGHSVAYCTKPCGVNASVMQSLKAGSGGGCNNRSGIIGRSVICRIIYEMPSCPGSVTK